MAEAAKNKVTSATPDDKQAATLSLPARPRIFLDDSLSMKGFAQGPDTTFAKVLGGLHAALPGCAFYGFGQKGQEAPADPAQLIRETKLGQEHYNSDFYGSAYNPDDRLVQELVKEATPQLSILITDGVYSTQRGQEIPAVITAFEKWFQRGGKLGILSFRSKFAGPLYSEKANTFLPPVTTDNRPFYVFVFSPQEQDFKNVREQLKTRLNDALGEVFFFSQEDITALPPAIPGEFAGSYDFEAGPVYYWQMFDTALWQQKGTATLTYQLSVKLPPDYPAQHLTPTCYIDSYRWSNGTFIGPQPNAGVPARCEFQGANKDALTLMLNQFSETPFSFYHVKVDWMGATPKYRPTIEALTTLDDADANNKDRTYRLWSYLMR